MVRYNTFLYIIHFLDNLLCIVSIYHSTSCNIVVLRHSLARLALHVRLELHLDHSPCGCRMQGSKQIRYDSLQSLFRGLPNPSTVCPRSLDPFYIVIYYIKGVQTSWTYSSRKPRADFFYLCGFPELLFLD